MDYYFENEWKNIQVEHPNYLNLNIAFSRDQPEKIYVQDQLLENSDNVFNLIHNSNCLILIAGNSKRMPEDVMAILEKIIRNNLEKSNNSDQLDELAKNYMKSLQAKFRIQLETWS
jgi:sulfite reductase alpha subunit-like flavoprotein